MQITLDIDKCIGSGSCEMLAPEVFAVGDDGLVSLTSEQPDPALRAAVRSAAASCPTGVITVAD